MSENYNAEKVRMGEGICVHFTRSNCHSSIGDSKIKDQNSSLSLICATATSRHLLVFNILFRTCAGKSDEVGYGDCRHEDHDDHCSASGS